MIPILLALLGLYLLVGLVFGIAFAFFGGARRIDPGAAEATWGFRFVILPGCLVFWPLLLGRWRSGSPPPEERSAHRLASRDS